MATIFQTSYSQRPSEAVPGMLSGAFTPSNRTGRAARGLIKAGYGCFKQATLGNRGATGQGTLSPGECFQIPNPGVAADVDAIVTAYTTSTAIQTFSGSSLNGVVGALEMQPARALTFVLSSHADWNATTATVTGLNHLGAYATESVSIPDAGNVTVTTTTLWSSVTSIAMPAQGGVGGTATIGISALSALTLVDFVGVAIRKEAKTTLSAAGLYGYPGQTSTLVEASYVDAEMVSLLETGDIWVFTEEAVSDGDPVFVRVAAGAGGSSLGAFRNDVDTASCVAVTGARFRRNATAGVALARFPYSF